MIGIAAIMGASGLGLLVYRAVINSDPELSSSAGLALLIVAVVLDRLTQTEAGEGTNLFARIRAAWRHWRDPEALLEEIPAEDTVADEADEADEGTPAPVGSAERAGVLIGLAASVVAVVSVFLPWGHDSGHVSAYSRAADLDRGGLSFSGLATEGGSFFGIAVLVAGLVILGSALTTLAKPGGVARWFGADGALISAAGMLASAGAYLWIGPPAEVVSYRDGVGAWLALGSGDNRRGRGRGLDTKRPLQSDASAEIHRVHHPDSSSPRGLSGCWWWPDWHRGRSTSRRSSPPNCRPNSIA